MVHMGIDNRNHCLLRLYNNLLKYNYKISFLDWYWKAGSGSRESELFFCVGNFSSCKNYLENFSRSFLENNSSSICSTCHAGEVMRHCTPPLYVSKQILVKQMHSPWKVAKVSLLWLLVLSYTLCPVSILILETQIQVIRHCLEIPQSN